MTTYIASKKNRLYLRLAIPKALQPYFHKAEVSTPLQANNIKQAKPEALLLTVRCLQLFQQLQQEHMTNKPTIEDLLKADLNKYEIDLPNGIKIKADSKDDHDRAMEALSKIGPINHEPELSKVKLNEALNSGLKPKNLTGALNDYIGKQITGSELRQKTNGLEHFRDYFLNNYPNIKVHQVRDDQIIEYKKVLESVISHKSKTVISNSTVIKRLRFISVFFDWCSKTEQKFMAKGKHLNPCFELIPDEKDDEINHYDRFEPEELKKIFNKENYYFNYKNPIAFWVPLLGLFTGASRGEIINLNPQNINNHNPEKVWTIRFEDNTKNNNSKRTIPLHETLIKTGFLTYIEDVKKVSPNAKTIFPFDCDVDKASLRSFTRLLERIELKTPSKVFHSFPKTVSDILSLSKVEDKYQLHYVGHLKYSIHRNIYTREQDPLKYYKQLIDKNLIFPYLDFSDFVYDSEMYKEYFELNVKK